MQIFKNAYYFKAVWETFGWNKLECEQTSVLKRNCDKLLEPDRGERKYFGSELVDKENAAAYNGAWMAGSYIRPFTVEFAAKITF